MARAGASGSNGAQYPSASTALHVPLALRLLLTTTAAGKIIHIDTNLIRELRLPIAG